MNRDAVETTPAPKTGHDDRITDGNVQLEGKEHQIQPEVCARGVIFMDEISSEKHNSEDYVSSLCLADTERLHSFKPTSMDAFAHSLPLRGCPSNTPRTATLTDDILSTPQHPSSMDPKTWATTEEEAHAIMSGTERDILSRTSSTASSSHGKTRWKLESEDSSYDSDYENSETLSPRDGYGTSTMSQALQHDEVSRTVSDTLAAEYADYVNTRTAERPLPGTIGATIPELTGVFGEESSNIWEALPTGTVSSEGAILSSTLRTHFPVDDKERVVQEEEEGDDSPSAEDAELEAILLDPNYTSRVEFALKLGYTEQQVQIALHKLGAQTGQNELLAELIKLGASSSTKGSGGGSGSDGSLLGSAATIAGVPSGSGVSSLCGASGSVLDDLHGSLDNLSVFGDSQEELGNLRPVVVDGSNVAMSHGNKEVFSCRGIKLCVDWFKARGHKDVTVFVPKWRKEASRPDARIIDQDILLELEKERRLVFTPSRFVGGRRLVCYDDRYILKLAAETDGIVVSNDNYRDLINENPEFKKVVDDRLLMYSFVNDRFMPPDDPLGRHGPSLDNFLRRQPKMPESLPPPCPYGKKCTYGNKCKYYHPERGNQPQKSVTERLVEQAKIQIQEVKARGNKSRDSSPGDSLKPKLTGTVSAPASSESKPVKKTPLSRTKSVIPPTPLPKELTEGSPSSVIKDDVLRTSAEQRDHKLETHSSQEIVSSRTTSHLGGVSDHHQVSGSYLNVGAGSSHPASSWASGIPSSIQPPTWGHPGMMPPMCSMPPVSSPSGLFYSDHGGHLSVAKRLSDPEKESGSVDAAPGGGNLHRKLQRQLTLNPLYDPRLFQMRSCIPPPHMTLVPPPSGCSPVKVEAERLHETQHPHGAMESRGGNDPMSLSGGHRPLVRHSSATEGHHSTAGSGLLQPPHMQWGKGGGVVVSGSEGGIHANVTRIASAPDSHCQWPPAHLRGNPPLQHLNSTSDTQLNLYHEAHSPYVGSSELFEHEQQHQQLWAVHHQQARPNQWAHPKPSMTRPQTPIGHVSQPLPQMRPSSVPPQHQSPAPVTSGEDIRNRVYFHLSSIFPQEQVQAAMMIYPEETNPQKICAAILSLFPPKGQ